MAGGPNFGRLSKKVPNKYFWGPKKFVRMRDRDFSPRPPSVSAEPAERFEGSVCWL
jgi:hypothetical protein